MYFIIVFCSIIIIYPFIVYFGEVVGVFRVYPQSRVLYGKLRKSNNDKFYNLLMKKGEVNLCENIKIDMSNWSEMTPKVSKLIGNGQKSTIELLDCGLNQCTLFTELKDMEISNINIEIKSIHKSSNITINNGLIKQMKNVKMNGFHIKSENIINIEIDSSFSFISNSIYNCKLTDVGISYYHMSITYNNNNNNNNLMFSYISNEVINNDLTTYEGIYLIGGIISIYTQYKKIESGLLFGNIKNTNFNYIVIDVCAINYEMKIQTYYSLFAYTPQSDMEINNISIIIINHLSYSDTPLISESNYLSGLFDHIPRNTKISLNNCIIDIIFDEIKVEYYGLDKNRRNERGFYFSGITRMVYENSKILMNYLIVRLYFKQEFISKSNKTNIYYGNEHKANSVCSIVTVNNPKTNSIVIKNSYIFISKKSKIKVDYIEIIRYHMGRNFFTRVFINDRYKIVSSRYDLIDEDAVQLAELGFKKVYGLVYYPNLPYIDYNTAKVIYEMYYNRIPMYKDYCDILLPTPPTKPTTTPTIIPTHNNPLPIPTTAINNTEIPSNNQNISAEVKTNKHTKISTSLVIVIIIFAVVFVCIILITTVIFRRFKRRRRKYFRVSTNDDSN